MDKFVPGQKLSDICPNDKPWDAHKLESITVSAMYGQSFKYKKYADRMDECAAALVFGEKQVKELAEFESRLKLVKAHFCRVRYCPVCQWRKALALKARFLRNLPDYLDELLQYAFIYVVLTIRSPEMSDLKSTIKDMNDGLKKMLKREQIIPIYKGFIKTIEITYNEINKKPHPHINLILAVPKSYFCGKYYISKDRWSNLWRSCLGLDYDPVVNVKKIKVGKKLKKIPLGCENLTDLIYGVIEVVKYSIKPADLISDSDFLYGVTEQCHGMRFLESGGCFKGIFKKDKKAKSDDVDSEEMLLKGEGDPVGKERYVFLWNYCNYLFSSAYIESEKTRDSGFE